MGVSYRNAEGYPDPVPYYAILHMERELKGYMPITYIASAFSGDVDGNLEKARAYCRFALDSGVIPIAPHLLFPQFMKEDTERELAMFMDIAVLSRCKELWVFGKPTAGMQNEIAYAKRKNMRIRYFSEKMEET